MIEIFSLEIIATPILQIKVLYEEGERRIYDQIAAFYFISFSYQRPKKDRTDDLEYLATVYVERRKRSEKSVITALRDTLHGIDRAKELW